MSKLKVGLVGARGYTGAELIKLLAAHPRFELAYVTSRELAGQRVAVSQGRQQGAGGTDGVGIDQADLGITGIEGIGCLARAGMEQRVVGRAQVVSSFLPPNQ